MDIEREKVADHLVEKTWLYQVQSPVDMPLVVFDPPIWDVVPHMILALDPGHFTGVPEKSKLLIEISGWIPNLGPVTDPGADIRFRFSINNQFPMEWRVPPGDPGCRQSVHGHYTVQIDVPREGGGVSVLFQYRIASTLSSVFQFGRQQLVVKAHLIDA